MIYNLQLIAILILVSPLFASTSSQRDEGKTRIAGVERTCEKNPDNHYDRKQILKRLAEILNDSAPTFRNYEKEGFGVLNDRPQRFFIYDLTDQANRGTPLGACVQLLNKHVYHVAPIYIPYSFSHILFLEDGKLTIFKSVNCDGGDNIQQVIKYLSANLPNDTNKDDILNRVSDYRNHGMYFTIDDLLIRCGEMKRQIQ